MLLKRIKINHFLSPTLTISHNIRWKGFTHSENKKLNLSRAHSREVLRQTNGCILFDASHHFDPSADFIKNDQIILKLLEIASVDRTEHSANNKWIYDSFPYLDMECVERSENWSIEQNLFVLDIWYHNVYSIARSRYKSEFFHQTPKQYLFKLKPLTLGPILQILFYFACSKRPLQEAEEKSILRVLLRELHTATLTEASIFYRTLVIGDCLPRIEYGRYVRRICNHLNQTDLEKEPEMAVTDTVKVIRRLSLNVHNKEIADLQMKLIPLAKNTPSPYLLTHIAQLGVRQKVFNPLLLEAVVEKLMEFLRKEPQLLRVKEVERSLLLIATYRFQGCADLIAKYCEEVQPHLKQSLDTKFPLNLVECIAHLATIGTCDHELIDWALRHCNDGARFVPDYNPQHFLIIDSFAKINVCDAYNGYTLSDSVCSELKLKYQSKCDVGFHHDMQQNFAEIFKEDNHRVLLTEAAPHFNSPDFLFIYDKHRKATVDIVDPSERGKILRASDLYAGKKHLVPVAFVTYTHKSLLCDDNRNIATGRFMMKLKQLELLGFKVVTGYLRSEEWKLISQSKMREKLLNRLSQEHIYLFRSDKKF